MKFYILLLFFLPVTYFSLGQGKKFISLNDSLLIEFKYHFNILDSVVKELPLDTLYYCCPYTIQFMETNTGIFSRSCPNFIGKLKFYKSELILWHKWFEIKN